MNVREMQIAFEKEAKKVGFTDKIDSYSIFYFINKAVMLFTLERYKDFEQNQRSIDDLRTLVREYPITLSANYVYHTTEEYTKQNSFVGTLPINAIILNSPSFYHKRPYMLKLGEEVRAYIGTNQNVLYTFEITHTTVDTYTKLLENPFGEHKLHYNEAKPLRLFRNNTVEIITDGQYTPTVYLLRCLVKPQRINIFTNTGIRSGFVEPDIIYTVSTDTITYGPTNTAYTVGQKLVGVPGYSTYTGNGTLTMNQTNCDLPEHTHHEVIHLAVNIALEDIKQQKYQNQTTV